MKRNTSKSQIADAFSSGNYYTELPNTVLYQRTLQEKYEYKRDCDVFYSNFSEPIHHATVITTQLPHKHINKKTIVKFNRETVNASNTYLLTSLLTLRTSLSPEIFEEFSSIEDLISVDEKEIYDLKGTIFKRRNTDSFDVEPIEISDKDLQMITRWCKKNGYPFSIFPELKKFDISHYKVITNDYISFVLRKKLIQPNLEIKFWVWEFLRRLQILYSTFLLFCKIGVKELSDIGIKDTTFLYYTIEDCKRLLVRIYNTVKLTGLLDIEKYEKGNKHMLIGYKTDNAFNLAVYSLFLYMSTNGKTIRRCPICSSFFEPRDPRQKYCHSNKSEFSPRGSCYPQLNYKRNRAKKGKDT